MFVHIYTLYVQQGESSIPPPTSLGGGYNKYICNPEQLSLEQDMHTGKSIILH